jgi:hypothetical protein
MSVQTARPIPAHPVYAIETPGETTLAWRLLSIVCPQSTGQGDIAMNITIVAAFASLILVAPAQAEPTSPAPAANATDAVVATPTQDTAPVHNAKTRYCYKTEATGTRIINRTCHTRAEWKELGVTVPATL